MQVKVCNRCNAEKSLDEFGKRKDSPDGRKYYCIPCGGRLAAEQRKRNPELESERQKRYYARNRDKQVKKAHSWNVNNRERFNTRMRESGQWRANTARYRAAQLRATPPWADQKAIRRVYSAASKVSRMTGQPHEVDHIVPLQGRKVSGLHVHWNLRVIPMPDNRSKGNRHV